MNIRVFLLSTHCNLFGALKQSGESGRRWIALDAEHARVDIIQGRGPHSFFVGSIQLRRSVSRIGSPNRHPSPSQAERNEEGSENARHDRNNRYTVLSQSEDRRPERHVASGVQVGGDEYLERLQW